MVAWHKAIVRDLCTFLIECKCPQQTKLQRSFIRAG